MLPYLLTFSRVALGLLFAYAFLAKVRDVAQFAAAVGRFELLPRRWVKTAALLFLAGELAVILLLLTGGSWLPLAFALASLLLTLFTLALLSTLRRGIETSCNCFGASEKPLTYYDVGRNAGFIACSLLGWWLVPQVAGSPAAQNWLALAWQGLVTVGDGNGLVILLTINALLTWFILLPTAFFMLLLGKRFRQLDQGDPKEFLLQEAGSRRGQPAPPFEAQNYRWRNRYPGQFQGQGRGLSLSLAQLQAVCREDTGLERLLPPGKGQRHGDGYRQRGPSHYAGDVCPTTRSAVAHSLGATNKQPLRPRLRCLLGTLFLPGGCRAENTGCRPSGCPLLAGTTGADVVVNEFCEHHTYFIPLYSSDHGWMDNSYWDKVRARRCACLTEEVAI